MTGPDLLCLMWGALVLTLEGHGDWEIEFYPGGREGIVLRSSKTLVIHWPTGEPDVALLLHEISHVVSGTGHDSWFAHVNMRLVREYYYQIMSEVAGMVSTDDEHAKITGRQNYSISDQIAAQQIC